VGERRHLIVRQFIAVKEALVRLRDTPVLDRLGDLRWDRAASASLSMRNMPIHAFFEVRTVRQPMLCMPLPVHAAPRKTPSSEPYRIVGAWPWTDLSEDCCSARNCWSAGDRQIGG
jgi:hypothetical protein